MIQKIVKKQRLQERAATQDDFAYWLSKTPEERVAPSTRGSCNAALVHCHVDFD